MKLLTFLKAGLGVVCLLSAASTAHATTYKIGPGQPLSTLGAVPWRKLLAGDVVQIYPKPGGYHETILLSSSGTKANPIVVQGVPDPQTGELPVLDGQNAVQASNIGFHDAGSSQEIFYHLGVIVVGPSKGFTYGYIPSNITIENLNIRHANKKYTLTSYKGKVTNYHPFASAIYCEYAQNLTVRNCTLTDSGNGFFVNSKYGTNGLSANILVDRCHIYHNGNVGSFSEHNIYTEANGTTIQYSRIGPLVDGSYGEDIKDRSAGTVFRYNYFEMNGPGHAIWLIQPEGGAGTIDQFPSYKKSFIYGNVIVNPPSGGQHVVRYDSGDSFREYSRRGTLHFYNNTIVNSADLYGPQGRYTTALFVLPTQEETDGEFADEIIDCRNNIIYHHGATVGAQAGNFYLLAGDNGTINLGKNWITPGYQLTKLPYGGTTSIAKINGTKNLIVGDAQGKNNPHFLDPGHNDYRLAADSNAIDKGMSQAADVQGNYDVTTQYVLHQNFKARSVLGRALDLGAFESPYTGASPVAAFGPSGAEF